jgi:hypothetical protein
MARAYGSYLEEVKRTIVAMTNGEIRYEEIQCFYDSQYDTLRVTTSGVSQILPHTTLVEAGAYYLPQLLKGLVQMAMHPVQVKTRKMERPQMERPHVAIRQLYGYKTLWDPMSTIRDI